MCQYNQNTIHITYLLISGKRYNAIFNIKIKYYTTNPRERSPCSGWASLPSTQAKFFLLTERLGALTEQIFFPLPNVKKKFLLGDHFQILDEQKNFGSVSARWAHSRLARPLLYSSSHYCGSSSILAIHVAITNGKYLTHGHFGLYGSYLIRLLGMGMLISIKVSGCTALGLRALPYTAQRALSRISGVQYRYKGLHPKFNV